MPPKKRKAAAKAKAEAPAKKAKLAKPEKVEEDEVAESDNYDGIIRIEYCMSWRVFKRKADKIFADLCDLLPERKLKLDLTSVRGAFEIYVQKPDQSSEDEVRVWSGKKKGPPRAKKFPEVADLVPAIEEALK